MTTIFAKIAAEVLAALDFGNGVLARLENIERWIAAHVTDHAATTPPVPETDK